jgi:anthranilate/para-aminobenzoate synthase component II
VEAGKSQLLGLPPASAGRRCAACRVSPPLTRRTRIAARAAQERVLEVAPSVVILSGGPNSVHEAGSPTVPPGFFEWAAAAKVPLLGICYGMQLLVQCLGGEVAPAEKREYGRMPIATQPSGLFADAASQMVWMSHGDEAKRLPDGFTCVAKSEQASASAAQSRRLRPDARAALTRRLAVRRARWWPSSARSATSTACSTTPRRVAPRGLRLLALAHVHVRKNLTPHATQVTHTDRGLETLRRFLFDIAHVSAVRSARALQHFLLCVRKR